MKRHIQAEIENQLHKGKVIVLYGARRVGKTFLSKQILEKQEKSGKKCSFINCELFEAKKNIETTNEQELKRYFGNADFVVLDEAQNIKNIGLVLKILVASIWQTKSGNRWWAGKENLFSIRCQ